MPVTSRISIEQAFQWVQRFSAREWRLLVPVAFAFIALPPLLFDAIVPDGAWRTLAAGPSADLRPMLAAAPWLMPLSLLATLIWVFGGLVVTAIGLVPRISVQEAIVLAFRRLPLLVVAMLLAAVVVILVATVAAVLIGLARVDVMAMQGLLVGVILGAGLFLSVRLVPLMPLLVERQIGPIAALRLSWALTQGAFWRILLALLLYLVGGGIVVLALGTAISATLVILGGAAGSAATGTLIAAILISAGRSVISAGFHLLVVSLYRQLAVASRGI
ncbi:hypothetical protein [Sphingomonas nostoxanthinifaciens]|uniref:hypothetical protein n=1 Tax=Sphingomonas nostoxanthinifaciens TaxID=2872652 RepID=UPI001CC20DA0|nr:hypothetical protein [Sphingomonas nostoxanthinifaciens]UAK25140.1 hypothetical protein K8P63_02745 [Sphingomonas nostoxanthinifaciens]